MHEIEIKFQVDPARRAELAAEMMAPIAGDKPPRRIHLQAAYFDTADRALARARIALRVRREGRRWVQTLKGAADDGMTRFEHNVDLPDVPGTPLADPALHAGTDLGDRLTRILEVAPGELICLYRTDVWRRTRQVRSRRGTVELAFDEGRILAETGHIEVCELEFELVSGSPLAVIETARRWSKRHGLVFDTRSKSERGDMLARDVRIAQPRRAEAVIFDAAMSLAEIERAMLRSCFDQISVNASTVASGEFEDEHVRQLRVGLMRLRATLGIFAFHSASIQVERDGALFDALRQACDRSAMATIETTIRSAIEAAAIALPLQRLSNDATPTDVTSLICEPQSQDLLLRFLAVLQSGS